MNKRFMPIASDFMEQEEQQKLIDIYKPIFKKYRLIQAIKPEPDCENYFFILTGGTENKCLELMKDLKNSVKIRIIAIGINNSLPASLEILAHVNQNGKTGKIYYLKDTNDHNGLSD
jgi:pyruvate/2-oxoacid:ferredoxin oxidoreductase alpha subunit